MTKQALYGWTDYPIERLCDKPGERAPVRACRIISYDGDKYVRIVIGGVEESIKRGYIYRKRGRLTLDGPDMPTFTYRECSDLTGNDKRVIAT